MVWEPSQRNFDGVQFESLRKQIDLKFNDIHDELSDAYYNGKPFRAYGFLTKEQFDKLHGLVFLMRDVVFHEENLKLPQKDQIPKEEYNWVDKDNLVKKSDQVVQIIAALKIEGFELVI